MYNCSIFYSKSQKENISVHFFKCLQTIVKEIQNIGTLDNHSPQIHSLWFNQLDNSCLSRAQGYIAYNMCLNIWFVYSFYYQIILQICLMTLTLSSSSQIFHLSLTHLNAIMKLTNHYTGDSTWILNIFYHFDISLYII